MRVRDSSLLLFNCRDALAIAVSAFYLTTGVTFKCLLAAPKLTCYYYCYNKGAFVVVWTTLLGVIKLISA